MNAANDIEPSFTDSPIAMDLDVRNSDLESETAMEVDSEEIPMEVDSEVEEKPKGKKDPLDWVKKLRFKKF